jgi:hypothetical protein
MNYTKAMKLSQDEEKDKEMKDHLEDLYAVKNLKKLWTFVKNNTHLFLKKDTTEALLKLL